MRTRNLFLSILLLVSVLVATIPNAGATTIVQVDVFTASGTWTKPDGAAWVQAICFGAGGGGGGGQGAVTLNDRNGGGGGGGGSIAVRFFAPGALGATEAVTVGAAGTAGVGSTAGVGGVDGGAGGASMFGSHLTAPGGGGGGQQNAAGSGGGGGAGTAAAGSTTTGNGGAAGGAPGGGAAVAGGTDGNPSVAFGGGSGAGNIGNGAVKVGGAAVKGGGGGGGGSSGGNGGDGGTSMEGGGGGGGGAGVNSANAKGTGAGAGGAGGDGTFGSGGGGAAGTGGGSGATPTSRTGLGKANGGGGGGDSSTTTTGGAGAAGGIPGGGGGGGGGGTNVGGAGGAGGRGECIITTWISGVNIDGFNSLILTTNEAPGANCATGGRKVESGLDDDRDGVLDAGEVDATTYVCNGATGPAGADGFDGLIDTTTEPPGANCASGGIKVESGTDNGDGGGTANNGILEAGEIDNTSYVCDGAVSLILDTPEAAGVNCATGGTKVTTGLDNGDGGGTAGNEVLEAGEVDNTFYVCNGERGPPGNTTMTTITTTSTYTTPATVVAVMVECVGGAGGGGGAAQTALTQGVGAGGGAGGYGRRFIPNPAASYSVTIGAGGAGGAAGANNGAGGGTTTFGTALTCNGGSGGTGGSAGNIFAATMGGAGGTAASGDVNVRGTPGAPGIRFGLDGVSSGNGAASYFGDGGIGRTTTNAGQDGDGYGAGGSGAAATTGTSNQAGGAGAPGLVIVWEFGEGEQGATGPTGPQGPAGADGDDGFDSVARSTLEPPGINCPAGGYFVEVGRDLDRDGILDVGEEEHDFYVCDGQDGATGPQGPQGIQGVQGPTGPIGPPGAGGNITARLYFAPVEPPATNIEIFAHVEDNGVAVNVAGPLNITISLTDGATWSDDVTPVPMDLVTTGLYLYNWSNPALGKYNIKIEGSHSNGTAKTNVPVLVGEDGLTVLTNELGIELGGTSTLNILLILLIVVIGVWLYRNKNHDLVLRTCGILIVLTAGVIALSVAPAWNGGIVFAALVCLLGAGLMWVGALDYKREKKNGKGKGELEL